MRTYRFRLYSLVCIYAVQHLLGYFPRIRLEIELISGGGAEILSRSEGSGLLSLL